MSVEDKYKKYTQVEHVLARPGMYIGELKTIKSEQWVLEDDIIVNREVKWNPGIYKIFDEIITNASDECQRNTSVKNIYVNIDAENNYISVIIFLVVVTPLIVSVIISIFLLL